MSVCGASSQIAYCTGFHWQNTGTNDEGKRKRLVSGFCLPPPPFDSILRDLQAAEANANFVSPVMNRGVPILERVGRLPSESFSFIFQPFGINVESHEEVQNMDSHGWVHVIQHRNEHRTVREPSNSMHVGRMPTHLRSQGSDRMTVMTS